MRLGVIIAAGGTGTRMKAGHSKQLLLLRGKPVLARTLEIFSTHGNVQEIVVAIDPADVDRCRREIVSSYGFDKVVQVVPGGETRAQSVLNAFRVLSEAVDTVAVHDGARPLFPADLLDVGLEELKMGGLDGVVFATPVIDTIKQVGADGIVLQTPGRAGLWAAQTPQIFMRKILAKAFEVAPDVLAQATDDSFLVEKAGGRVKVIPGIRENLKITTPIDLVIAEEVLRIREAATPGVREA